MFRKIINSDFYNELLKLSQGEFYFVGGCVRDFLLEKECKDYDLIIRNVPIDLLTNILLKYGSVDIVGKSFGILKFMPKNLELNEPLDICLPRTEKSNGDGHKDFLINSDETIDIKDDLLRRDFTINTLLMDCNMNVLDLLGTGISDLRMGKIRVVTNNSFKEDPLRMIRALQFACRFNFDIDYETFCKLKLNSFLINTISKERIYIEIMKVVNKKGNYLKMIKLLNNTGISTYLFNCYFIDFCPIKNKFDFWFTLGQCHFKKANGKRLKDKIVCTNYEETLCDLMAEYVKYPTVNNFLNLYNFDKHIINCTLLDFEKFIYIIDTNLPTKIKDLNINGNELMELGYKGYEIGIVQKTIFNKILNKELNNNKQEILTFLNNSK